MQMAVFLLNNCKFQGCGRAFSSLADLIHHIEDSHIGKNLMKCIFREKIVQKLNKRPIYADVYT